MTPTVPPTPDRRLLADLVLGRSGVDRAAERRTDAAWLAATRADPGTRVLLVHEGRTPVRDTDDGTELAFVPPSDVDADAETHLLGVAEGIAYLAARVPDREPPPGAQWRDLRQAGAALGDRDAGLLVTAVALGNWHDSHPHCARCGTLTEVGAAGWNRRCPVDDSEHYPRTDPAVIVLVLDDDDRALLGRQTRWPPGWYSTLAGFVEAGETAEGALRREVFEESGVRIGTHPDDVTYLGSQPWPFPSSLMLGYHARAVTTEIHVDGDEIGHAAWFSRAELAAACAAGEVRLPPSLSIARKLVERWYGGPLPSDWSRG